MAPQPRSVLVYIGSTADDALGENMIKLPFLWAIHDAFPDARITWIPGIGPAQFDGILKSLTQGLIHEMVTDCYLGTNPMALFSQRPLAGREFDLIIDTQKSPVRTLLLRRIPHQSFISSTWGYVFSDAKPPADHPAPRLLIDKLLALVAAAAGRAIRPDHLAPVAADCQAQALAMLPEGPVHVGFAPGAGRKDTGKCWPLERFISLANDQKDRGRVPVFILGPNEAEWLDQLKEAVPGAVFPGWDGEASTQGLRDPALTVALGARLAVAVANCSGTGHMLAAGGVPMVSLYGPSDAGKFAPYTPHIRTLSAKDFGGTAIGAIPAEAVARAIEAHLADLD